MSEILSTCACGTCATCAATGAGVVAPGRRGLVAPGRLHSDFKTRMLDAMARSQPLSGLSTRADDDPAVALADAWAASLHVLSFYLERYHGRSYIDTTDDIDAVNALARMVGYQPAPAISAGTTLTFRIDSAAGNPASTRIPRGTKVQTVPGAGETPVLFETSAAIEARGSWNELTAKRRELVQPHAGQDELRIKETFIAGRPGDVIALIKEQASGADIHFAYARIDHLDPKPLDATRPPDWIAHQIVKLDVGLTAVPNTYDPHVYDSIAVFSRRASLFGYNAPTFRLLAKEVRERILGEGFPKDDTTMPTELKYREWPGLKARVYTSGVNPQPTKKIDLDAVYPEAFNGRYIMLVKGDAAEVFKITAIEEIARTAHGLSSRVSRLTLDRDPASWDDDVRNTSVLIQSEIVTLAESPIAVLAPTVAQPDRIDLAADCDLPPGRLVVVQGEGTVFVDPASPKIMRAEPAVVKDVVNSRTLIFEQALRNRYDPQTLVVLGNASPATHGETKMTPAVQGDTTQVMPEIIGSGDARQRYQVFALRQGPLTYVGAANARGYEPAIEVDVDAEQRPRVDTLYGQPEQSRAYALEGAPDGATLVRFAGRLRTAANNVGAIYRVGGGSGGNLVRGRLVLPLTMPIGLREVTNPVPANGGVDPEDIESARRNAPIRIVTLDRIVSLGDYEAFARAYGGIGKALASLIWSGGRQVVHLTVAGTRGASVRADSDLFKHLADAIVAASAPGRGFRLLDYTARNFTVSLGLLTDAAFKRADVERDVQAAFAAAYSPEQREFGMPVAKSQLLACAQSCRGVVAAHVLELRDPFGKLVTGEVLGAAGATDTMGAELLSLKAGGLLLQDMSP